MVVPRTPRPPIIAPKPAERTLDPTEIERWVGRLARAIRLNRLERGYLGGGVNSGGTGATGGGSSDAGRG
jgi:hypothetical protein